MKEIFTDLYKKVIGFFQTQEKEEHSESKNVAVNRMKLVLMQDRTNLTPFLLERMRGEMIEVLAKYVEMDKEALELNFEQEGDQMALMLSIPVLRAKEEEEIQAIIEEEEKEKREKEKEKEESEEAEEGEETEVLETETQTEKTAEEIEAEETEDEEQETVEQPLSEKPAKEETEVLAEAKTTKKSKKKN